MTKICLRCGKECTRINSHLKNKNICKPIYLNVSSNKIIENYDEYYQQFIICKYKKDNGVKEYECEYCDKQYACRNSYYRHKTNKHANIDDSNKVNINNNTTNNTLNNTINNNTMIDTVNITINGFGNEKLLSKETIAKILKEPMNRIIPEYVKQTYIEIPENRCIYIPNIRGKFANIFVDGVWELKSTTPIVDTLINKSSKYIMGNMGDCNRKLIEVNGVKVEDPIRKKRCDFRNYLHDINEDSTKRKIVQNDVIAEIMNGRDKVLETKNTIKSEPVNPDEQGNMEYFVI